MEGLLIISKGQLFLIGAKEGKPIYTPIDLETLSEYLKQTSEDVSEDVKVVLV